MGQHLSIKAKETVYFTEKDKIISGASYRVHPDPLFCDLKLLKLDDINALQQCNFLYKNECVNDQQVPQQLRKLFQF